MCVVCSTIFFSSSSCVVVYSLCARVLESTVHTDREKEYESSSDDNVFAGPNWLLNIEKARWLLPVDNM